jgi:hypothetical protein
MYEKDMDLFCYKFIKKNKARLWKNLILVQVI